MKPTIQFLRECFDLDESTGVLTWKVRPASHFRSKSVMKSINTTWSGKVAGYLNDKGYMTLKFDGRTLAAHVAVWALYHGEYPAGLLDHADGNRENNSPTNLRLATTGENCMNRPKIQGTTSKYKGVFWHARSKKWRSAIGFSGKRISLGVFSDEDEAGHAYNKAAIQYHGEFAVLNPIGIDRAAHQASAQEGGAK